MTTTDTASTIEQKRAHLDAWLKYLAHAEAEQGARMFISVPDRWYEPPHYRCANGHVSTMALKSEELGGLRCLANGCMEPLWLTYPEDTDGPLPTLPPPEIRPCERYRDPGWTLAAQNDTSGRRGIYFRTTPKYHTSQREPYVLELCGGREGDDHYARFEVPVAGPLRVMFDGLLGCLLTGNWMILEGGFGALPAAMKEETRQAEAAYMDRDDDVRWGSG